MLQTARGRRRGRIEAPWWRPRVVETRGRRGRDGRIEASWWRPRVIEGDVSGGGGVGAVGGQRVVDVDG
ncbi:MAG: hypothetical protein KDK70_27350, partial [Myxococcales bacterium]|nr:hypothetical protein [Myxococcales bacterium]